jgi:hypothetical protein
MITFAPTRLSGTPTTTYSPSRKAPHELNLETSPSQFRHLMCFLGARSTAFRYRMSALAKPSRNCEIM